MEDIKFINYKNNKDISKDIAPLYISSFPVEERPPLDLFLSSSLNKDNELLGIYEKDKFIGFTNLLFYKDICYIFFLATTPEIRNKGYGAKILKKIFDTYLNKRFVLCYEEIDDQYIDNELRKRRRYFYLRNGFKDNKLKTLEYGVRYDTIYKGDSPIKFNEYLNLLIHHYGNRVIEIIKEAN